MVAQAGTARTLRWGLGTLALALLAVMAASLLLPTTVGRVVADLWVSVMSAIAQLLGG
jgi:hypothetical protein